MLDFVSIDVIVGRSLHWLSAWGVSANNMADVASTHGGSGSHQVQQRKKLSVNLPWGVARLNPGYGPAPVRSGYRRLSRLSAYRVRDPATMADLVCASKSMFVQRNIRAFISYGGCKCECEWGHCISNLVWSRLLWLALNRVSFRRWSKINVCS